MPFAAKNRVFSVFALFVALCFFACSQEKGDENASNSNKVNSNQSANANADSELKKTVEQALKKEGFNEISLDLATNPPTLRGIVPKDKMAIAIMVAETAAKKKLENGLTEK